MTYSIRLTILGRKFKCLAYICVTLKIIATVLQRLNGFCLLAILKLWPVERVEFKLVTSFYFNVVVFYYSHELSDGFESISFVFHFCLGPET